MRRTVKKILKYGVRSFLVILLILLLSITGLYFYMNTAPGRRFLASEISYYVGKTFGTEFSIGNAQWDFPATISLDNVIIKDLKHNNMFVIGKLNAGLVYFNYRTSRMIFSKVSLRNVDFNLVLYKGDTSSNFGYVIDRLTEGTGAPRKYKTDILFHSVDIENLHFKWDDQRSAVVSYPGIDWNHVDVTHFDGHLTAMKIDGNDVSAEIKSLVLDEKSGFRINNMTGNAKYTDKNIEIKNLDLITPDSRVRKHIRIDYANTDSMVDFVHNVDINAEFIDSKVSFKDLAYFTPDLKNKTDAVNITRVSGKGKVSDLHITNLEASFGKNSIVKGRADLQGLPDIHKTFMAIRLAQTRTSKTELAKLFPEILLPDEMDRLGQINLKGYFTGFISNFKTNTEFETGLGNGSADVEMKISSNPALSSYSGKIDLDRFDIGKLSGQSLLGKTSLSGQVSGKGLSVETVQARLIADVKNVDFNRYNYQNIKVNGDVAKKFFNGSLNVNDRNLTLDFKGSIDYRKRKPEYDFKADMPNANLYALNFVRDSLRISTKLNINIEGIKPDDIDGQIIATGTKLTIPGNVYDIDSIMLNSKVNANHRFINLHSNLLVARIDGDFQISKLGNLFKSAARQYIDSGFYQFGDEEIKGQYINFDIRFNHLAPIFSVLRTHFSVADSGYLKGSYYSDGNKLVLKGDLPDMSYKNLHFKDLAFNGLGSSSGLNLDINVGAFINKDTELVNNAVIHIKSNSEKLFFDISASDLLNQKQAVLHGSFDVVNRQAFLDITDSRIKIQGETWAIHSPRIIFYGDTLVTVPDISFSKRNEKISVEGSYSVNNSYPIRVIMENLDLATVANFVPQISGIGGMANGQVLISNINTKPIFESAIYVSSISYNSDTFGTISAETDYSESSGRLGIDAKLYNAKGNEVATATGAVNTDQSQALALNVKLNQTEIKIFEPFINYVFSDVKGEATADMLITGTISQPSISGNIDLQGAEFKVNYTNVRYHFSHSFSLSGHTIGIKNLKVYDPNNNIAMVNGEFDLNNLKNIALDINIDANKVLALNTNQKINDLYFGKGVGTGRVSISGPLSNLKFVIKMRTEKGTTFSLPISSGNSFYGYDYIKFINKSNYLKGVKEVKLTGIELAMELEITPDAFAQIIFDPRVGDIIEAHGKGNLRLDVNSDGDFTMFGTYTIKDGKYRFTAFEGIINKSFIINSGSTITWNGSPYEAQLNLQAMYTVRTSLSPLMSASAVSASTASTSVSDLQTREYDRVYPVEAILNLKGSLFQPEIRLDFNIEELNEANAGTTDIQTRVNQIKGSQQDIDQQVVSLLVLNQFAPVDQSSAGGLGGVNNLTNSALNSSFGDLVASQVNDWLAKVPALESLHVGLNRSQEEFSVKLSRDLFQQRANISVSYDFDYQNYNTQLAYKITPDGNHQIKAFGRSNNNTQIGLNSNTQGIGYSRRIEFDRVSELFRKRVKKDQPKP